MEGGLRFEPTGDLDEDVPDAGPPPVLVRHALHLIRRRRRPKHEPFRKRLPAQPPRVQLRPGVRPDRTGQALDRKRYY